MVTQIRNSFLRSFLSGISCEGLLKSAHAPRFRRFGAWRSLVARVFWVHEAAGSSPAAPTSGLGEIF